VIKGWLLGGEDLIAKFDSMSPSINASLKKSVGRLTLELLREVKADKLSGQALNVRTGRLRRSINQRIESNGTSVAGYVGTNVKYGAYQEYGFHGQQTVKAHLRMMTQAFGRTVKEPHQIMVSAHTRNVNYPAHSFLRSALSDMTNQIQITIKEDLEKAAQEVFRKTWIK
jgi:phage gpG-like protein